jgi:tetratricopeptide (TPR) repeat protein
LIGELDEAIEWTERAVLAAPNDVTLYQMRAGYCLSLGLARMARETYERTRKVSDDIEELDAQLAATDFAHSTRAGILLTAARLHLLVNDVATARHLTDRALAAADFDANLLEDPWSLRWGYSDAVIVALAEQRTGDSKTAEARIRKLAATLDRLANELMRAKVPDAR